MGDELGGEKPPTNGPFFGDQKTHKNQPFM